MRRIAAATAALVLFLMALGAEIARIYAVILWAVLGQGWTPLSLRGQ